MNTIQPLLSVFNLTVNPLIFISERLRKLRYFSRPNIPTLGPLENVCILYQLGCEVFSVISQSLNFFIPIRIVKNHFVQVKKAVDSYAGIEPATLCS